MEKLCEFEQCVVVKLTARNVTRKLHVNKPSLNNKAQDKDRRSHWEISMLRLTVGIGVDYELKSAVKEG